MVSKGSLYDFQAKDERSSTEVLQVTMSGCRKIVHS